MKKAKDCFIGVFYGGLLAIGYWLSMNGVAVIIVEDEDVVVATGGWNYKTASLIRAYLASAVGVDVMCAVINWQKSGFRFQGSTKDISIRR